jgi:hypothetical protein
MLVAGKPVQSSLVFVGKAWSGAPERCFTWVGSGLTRKYWTRLERLAKDKHSSLLQKSINYGCKKFNSTGPGGQCYKNTMVIDKSNLLR